VVNLGLGAMQLQNLTRMDRNRLQEHVFGTYVALRYGIAIITLVFPLAVYLAGKLSGMGLLGSLSAYYWANGIEPNTARTVFVGGLFAIAVFMYLYKGFTHAENFALNTAAVLAALVALVPTKGPGWDPHAFHGTFAITLFVCLTYVVWLRAADTLSLLPPEGPPEDSPSKRYSRAWYRRRYKLIGLVMLVSPLTAAILNTTLGGRSYIFFIESTGVWAFGWYWFAKSSELKRSLAIRRALHGHIRVESGRAMDVTQEPP